MTLTSTETGGMGGSFLLLRRAIGWIGTLLPIVVILGDAAFSSGPLPNSLSDYYYTPMRNILVGALCVLGVAFLPGSPPVPHLTTSQEVIGNLHVFFASIAFLGLAATMWRFAYAVSDGPDAPPPSPRGCVFYRVSACVMLGFVLLSGVAILLPLSIQNSTLAIYDTEALAIFTFGISWLVKGRALQPLASAPAVARFLGERQDAGRAASA